MYPLPLIFSSKNTVRSSIPGKPTEVKSFEDISEGNYCVDWFPLHKAFDQWCYFLFG